MGKPGAFLEHGRQAHGLRDVAERTGDYNELYELLAPEQQQVQASRCTMCGVAFCQTGICVLARRARVVAPCTTSFPSGTTSSIVASGRKRPSVWR